MLGRGKESSKPELRCTLPLLDGGTEGPGFTSHGFKEPWAAVGGRRRPASWGGRERVRKQPQKHRLSWPLIRVALESGRVVVVQLLSCDQLFATP